ncbi:MAG: glutathione-disulfide reductase [Pelagibacterales bacterium]|nr:glutathione-disulfide reductase [Pelagibacterales bacterium]PPR16569.1 MAG: Glutathione amide reductase [Alphaproteobacteria bacterium MarineAlpha9_Bin3]
MNNKVSKNNHYDLIVIGAGSGGVRASRIAANYGAKVAIIESVRVGGTCVLRGCVPKKLLVYGSHFASEIEDSQGFGWEVSSFKHDWQKLINNKNTELDRLNNIYLNLLSKVNIINGFAKIISKNEVEVNGEVLSSDTILIAVGGKAYMPDIKGKELCINSDAALDLKKFPSRIVINGGGYIALEFAGIFASFGANVTIVYRGTNLLRGFDSDISKLITEELKNSKIKVLTEIEISSVSKTSAGLSTLLSNGEVIISDEVMFATGRVPNTNSLGLEKVGIKTGSIGEIIVDDNNETNLKNIFAIGDVTNRINLTPVAIAEGQVFADNRYGGMNKKCDYDNVASAVFTQPAIGVVGLTENKAEEIFANDGGISVFQTSFKPMKQTLGGRNTRIYIKMIVSKKDNKVVGIHGIGDDLPEIVQICAVAIKSGATKDDFDNTMGIHPTAAEELVTLK